MFLRGIDLSHKRKNIVETIDESAIPHKIILPLIGCDGSDLDILVRKGDRVKTGQKIASPKSDDSYNVPIYASISGIIFSIESKSHPITGQKTSTIIIESDAKDEKVVFQKINADAEKEELIKNIRDAGILSKENKPVYLKLSPKKSAYNLIIDCTDDENSVFASALFKSRSKNIFEGIDLIRQILDPQNIFFMIPREDILKKEIIELEKKERISLKEGIIKIMKVDVRYPLNNEKFLTFFATGIMNNSHRSPIDSGCMIFTLPEIFAIYERIFLGKPFYEKIISVNGDVMQEKNITARNGAIVSELIAECGGPKGTPKKIIFNGIFSGDAISDDSVAILANTCSITIINEENISKKDRNECMRCGRCVRVCPINLIPALLMKYAKKGMTDKARELNIEECIECGLCAYDCPSRIPILEYIRIAKKEAKTEVN